MHTQIVKIASLAAIVSCKPVITTDETEPGNFPTPFYEKSDLLSDGFTPADFQPQSCGLRPLAQAECGKTRVLVLPFDNRSGKKALQYLSLGLAADVAERLEGDDCVTVMSGQLVLESDQARADTSGDPSVNPQILRLAESRGANMVLTGKYAGAPENWTLTVDTYLVKDGKLTLSGTCTVIGNQFADPAKPDEKPKPPVKMARVQMMLASASVEALTSSGVRPSEKTIKALNRPSTGDSYAFILHARALFNLLVKPPEKRGNGTVADGGSLAPKDDDSTALGAAEHAVRVDPKFEEAQRLYAYLLAASADTVKVRNKARIHYEEALKLQSDDIRVLAPLGRIEAADANYGTAREYLKRAIAVNPNDPEPHYWMGRTLLGLNDRAGAVAAFEKARDLDGFRLDSRKELVKLYSTERRYQDAVRELYAITKAEPKNLEAAFQLASCLRADGRLGEAAKAYADAAVRFPTEPRLHKFLGDLKQGAGEDEAALVSYRQAFKLAPKDPRLAAILSGKPKKNDEVLPIGGAALVALVGRARETVAELESLYPRCKLASNDVVMTAATGGKERCESASPSALLAKHVLLSYKSYGLDLDETVTALRASLSRQEEAALTPDETDTAKQAVAYADRAHRDYLEMLSLFRKAVLPSIAKAGCKLTERATAADYASVLMRNGDRRVELSKVQPPRWSMAISPDVPNDPVHIVKFRVTNLTADKLAVFIDGTRQDRTAPNGKTTVFETPIGLHDLCVVPEKGTCDEHSVRHVFLHQGWEMKVRPGW